MRYSESLRKRPARESEISLSLFARVFPAKILQVIGFTFVGATSSRVSQFAECVSVRTRGVPVLAARIQTAGLTDNTLMEGSIVVSYCSVITLSL